MDKALIESATGKLELLNVVLHTTRLSRNSAQDPLSVPADLRQESMLAVRTEELTYQTATSDEKFNLFRVYIDLGVRAVNRSAPQESENNGSIYFGVEATFRVDYFIKEELTKVEAEEFSNFNAVHNVWPFWREHVSRTLRAAELPVLNIPLMRGLSIKSKTPAVLAQS